MIGLISEGTGQGDIYKVINDKKEIFALKLFHTGKKKDNLEQIKKLIKRGQACDAFVTPLEIVEINERVGYVMEYVDQSFIGAAALCNGIEADGRTVNIGWTEKLVLLGQITEAFSILNGAGLGVMDIKFDNIRIDPNGLRVKILDTDTIVYKKDKPLVLGTVGYMPPLTHTGKERPNEYNDAYAVAVLIFMTLLGIHPLEGKRRDQPCNEKIDSYLFGTHPLYVFHPHDPSNRPIPQDGFGRNQQQAIDKFKRYPDYFKQAMERVFVDGLFDGSKRTPIREWSEILENLYRDSYICENCGEEYFYDNPDKTCSVCKQELMKPVFLRSEDGKKVGLFNGLTVFSDDLFATTARYEVFKVVETKYNGRFGLLNLRGKRPF